VRVSKGEKERELVVEKMKTQEVPTARRFSTALFVIIPIDAATRITI